MLAKGRQLFFGPATHAKAWFTTGLGLSLPANVPLADFIADMANVDFDKTYLYRGGSGSTVDSDAETNVEEGTLIKGPLQTEEDLEQVGVGVG